MVVKADFLESACVDASLCYALDVFPQTGEILRLNDETIWVQIGVQRGEVLHGQ